MDATGAFHNQIEELEAIADSRYENIFRMFSRDEKYFYNILRRVNIDIDNADPQTFNIRKIKYDMPWTVISYRAYGTTDLWWMVYFANQDKFKSPLELVPGGTELNIIKPVHLRDIVDEINQELTPKV